MFVACSYPWKYLLIPQQQSDPHKSAPFIFISMDMFNTQWWFVSKDCISVETRLPIRFLETAYMSQHEIVTYEHLYVKMA
jgi:hypothetical protein